MITYDLNIVELNGTELMEINGGQMQPSPSPWWSVGSVIVQAVYYAMKEYASAYVQYSMDTGGQYVIHHAY
jgi:hypothetical protein